MALQSDQLASLIALHSYRKGRFLLSSGGTSDTLIDMSRTLRHPESARWVEVLLQQRPVPDPEFDCVGGPSLGADPFAAIISRVYQIPWFSVRREAKHRGLDRGRITGPCGTNVILVDDVVTTGSSAVRAGVEIQKHGMNVVYFMACVDREEGGMDHVKRAFGCEGHALCSRSQIERFVR